MGEVASVRNMEIAWVFSQLADMLEYKGGDFFKVRAYRRAARSIAGLENPVADLYKHNQLKNVPGLGKNIIAKIGELLSTGELKLLKELQHDVPASLMELMTLPGLGPKRVQLLHEQLGVATLAELETAARAGKVRKLPGLGSKTEQEIVRSLTRLRKKTGLLTLGAARELARGLEDYLHQMAAVQRVEVVGQVRRWTKLVDSVHLLVVARDTDEVLDSLIIHPNIGEVLWREKDRLQLVSRWGVNVDLTVVPEEQFWYALLWSTGSQEHYHRLQFIAWQRGWRLSRQGLFPRAGGERPRVEGEEDIYRLLGMQYIVPELRENSGELGAAQRDALPQLLETGDIRGDLHVHSDWSDGTSSIEDMVKQAHKKGYSYLAITDHSESLKIARGLASEKLLAQHARIRELNRQWEDFEVLTGIEVDILADGSLDCPDEVLADTDVVVASVHSGFKQGREQLMNRIQSAIAHEYVDIIGHPTGRLLGHREPYDVDVEEIIETAARYGKVLEINASPDRLDLDEFYVRLARESGVRVAINTDAHDLFRLDDMVFGVSVARRACLEPKHVLNTMPLSELMQVLRK